MVSGEREAGEGAVPRLSDRVKEVRVLQASLS